MKLVENHADHGTVRSTCQALRVSRATYYRRKKKHPPNQPKRRSPRRLSEEERQCILRVLCSEEFADLSPYQVQAKLLQRGQYLCSIRTMYRILKENRATTDRRNQRRHPKYTKPQLEARAANQVWTWDISKIPGPYKGIVYNLYVILDLFSRYVVSWTIENNESTAASIRLVRHAMTTQAVGPDHLTLHADRGSPMTSSGLRSLMETLGVVGSHSRPRVSNDNAFSEAQFKTVKYHRFYPKRFQSLHDAERYFISFFAWYNRKHHHINLGLFTPSQVHHGTYQALQKVRQAALDRAYTEHPERFVNGPPKAPQVPTVVAINPDPPSPSIDQGLIEPVANKITT